MKNNLVVYILNNIAELLKLGDDKFRPRAYINAARTIELLEEDIAVIAAEGRLQEIPGVGKHIAEKIQEIVDTGESSYYEKLKQEIGIDVETLFQVPYLGPKKLKVLNEKLGVKTLQDLQKVCEQHKVRELKGFGAKTEQQLLEGIEHLKNSPKRTPYDKAAKIATTFLTYLKTCKAADQIEIAGSFRREEPTIGDLDFLVISTKPLAVMNHVKKYPHLSKVLASGKTKTSIRLTNHLQIDVRVVTADQFGAALLYFTGNKNHNVALRKIAIQKKMTLNEYGLYKGEKVVASKTEEEIYTTLGLKFIPPQQRHNHGEIEAAKK